MFKEVRVANREDRLKKGPLEVLRMGAHHQHRGLAIRGKLRVGESAYRTACAYSLPNVDRAVQGLAK